MKTEVLKDMLYIVVGAIYNVHEELGGGLNESIYQEGLELELQSQQHYKPSKFAEIGRAHV